MRKFQALIVCALVVLLQSLIANAAPAGSSSVSNEVWSVFERFVKEKHALEKSIAAKRKIEIPASVEEFFAAAQKGDWVTTSNRFYAISDQMGTSNPEHKAMRIEPWGPIHDTFGSYEIIHAMHPKFVKMFGEEIVKGIPAGSIYFGGTAEGRFLVSAFSQSHSEGRPFFTLTQNALADPLYISYTADMYGDKIHLADTNDSENCLSEYKGDAKLRILHDQKFPNQPRQVKPGEGVELDADGKVQVNGYIGVMAVNSLIAKVVFDKNPRKEFYVEESFPLEWMFPHLMPNGLILKVNRQEIPELTEEVLKRDHEFWSKMCAPLVGDWITYETTVKDITAFAEKVVLHDDYDGFKGDKEFVVDDSAQRAFSKLRVSIARAYGWRLGEAVSGNVVPSKYIAAGANHQLLERETDFAFKQAFALAPFNPEVVFLYVQFLVDRGRVEDALRIAETAAKISTRDVNLKYLIDNLKTVQRQMNSNPK